MGSMGARLEDRFFVSSEGSVIEQHVYQISPELTATAVESGRKVKSRTTGRTRSAPATKRSSGPACCLRHAASAKRQSRT